jgi:hypothetical protein
MRALGNITGSTTTISHLRVWGCKAYVHVQRDQRTKTSSHTRECIFIGYPDDHKAWRFYDPKAKEVIISRDAIFDESSFFYPPRIGAPVVPTSVHTPPNLTFFLENEVEQEEDNISPPPPTPAPVPTVPVVPATPTPRPSTPTSPSPVPDIPNQPSVTTDLQ